MYSRRHPYLFAIIVLAALAAVSTVSFSLMIISVFGRKSLGTGSEGVGVVEVVGPLVESRDLIDQLKEFREDEKIKAIVLRIDSPGGAVGPAQEIYREIRKTIEAKAVIASLGSVAASGGYYIAAACDGIVANPGTITGSIGVIMGYTNFEALMQKIGLSPVVVKSGEYKDMGSPMRAMTAREKKLLQALAQNIHRQFVTDVTAARGLEEVKVQEIADGRIITGEEAKTMGLVDRMGNFRDAVQWAAELGGINGEVNTIYPEKDRLSWVEYLLESAARIWPRLAGQRLVPQAKL